MKKWVSSIEKREFLKWFLQHHRLKRTDARKVLEYIINTPAVLENVSFTNQIQLSRKTIVVSSTNSDEPGFEFYYNQRKTDNISTALSELMVNPSDKVYILIHFYGKSSNFLYLKLIEASVTENIRQYRQYEQDAKEAQAIIDQLMIEQEKQLIKKQIDEALDKKDETLFHTLLDKLKKLNTSG